MKPHFAFFCLLIALFLFGCKQHSSDAWTTVDSWYHPATKSYDEPVHSLTEKEFYEITASKLPQAEVILKEQSIVSISHQQAEGLVGHSLPQMSGKSTFLVRAVYLNAGTGAFSVESSGHRLWVSHGSLGHSAVPMKRQALVVFLKGRPDEVFVNCMMAE